MYQSVRNKKSIREKFVAFLEARNVSRTMLDATSVIPPLGQIEVPGGGSDRMAGLTINCR